ncbi:helix-turn-helix transcriptional regulator [Halomonas sp. GFAJ-1]|uniref:helix-turn-helix transcriptional regulator n=1 Tax=Halomonas sp. GFAJ-1 TaxID=1118153 RepID=UPI00023A4684|nr:helix-turn-helix transcriptional regulator [Halomonas sp. GFAJ-1]AVI63382.1 AraC family transcriptional regulator [Halomonas sp. GFAJ-1]EHK62547.1 AraC family transcriptional regulator [Halomonas sp. GFAJ-1]
MFNAMTRAEIWLQDTLDKTLGIEDLANHLGYSSSQIRRQFRQCFDVSPSAYREKRRLERAAVLLSLTPQNIAQIALRCGYLNHSSFSRAFHRRYQLTPRNYRYALSGVRHLSLPERHFKTTIVRSQPKQTVLMRLYSTPELIHGLGVTKYHANQLECFQAHLEPATPAISLPDLLSEKVEALEDKPSVHQIRTDIGLYLESNTQANHLALPVAYRRVAMPSHYYAKTCFEDFSELSQAMTSTLIQLMRDQKQFHVSGEAPRVLWHPNHLELQTPLLS